MGNNSSLFDISEEFEGKRVLVTGGTKGIGNAIVLRLLNSGARIITTARTVSEVLPDSVGFIQADVSTPEGTEKIIKDTLEKLGGLDILVNNIGGSSTSTAGALGLSDEDWLQTELPTLLEVSILLMVVQSAPFKNDSKENEEYLCAMH